MACGCFFFNDTATTEIYTLSLHDALPIYPGGAGGRVGDPGVLRRLRLWRSGSSADRKSTRLNSSHGYISYAVFCLKKKTHIVLRFSSGIRDNPTTEYVRTGHGRRVLLRLQ